MQLKKFDKSKNKKCQRPLPKGYKHKYCENFRNEHVKRIKGAEKTVLGVAIFVGGTALTIVTEGKFNFKE